MRTVLLINRISRWAMSLIAWCDGQRRGQKKKQNAGCRCLRDVVVDRVRVGSVVVTFGDGLGFGWVVVGAAVVVSTTVVVVSATTELVVSGGSGGSTGSGAIVVFDSVSLIGAVLGAGWNSTSPSTRPRMVLAISTDTATRTFDSRSPRSSSITTGFDARRRAHRDQRPVRFLAAVDRVPAGREVEAAGRVRIATAAPVAAAVTVLFLTFTPMVFFGPRTLVSSRSSDDRDGIAPAVRMSGGSSRQRSSGPTMLVEDRRGSVFAADRLTVDFSRTGSLCLLSRSATVTMDCEPEGGGGWVFWASRSATVTTGSTLSRRSRPLPVSTMRCSRGGWRAIGDRTVWQARSRVDHLWIVVAPLVTGLDPGGLR